MNITEKQLHIASQYLAMAGKNYVEAKDDDSHTNIGWITDKKVFHSREFKNGNSLEFDPCGMKLKWIGSETDELDLIGSSHKEVTNWIGSSARKNGLGPYVFDLHYEIESGEIADGYIFNGIDTNICTQLNKLRDLANSSLEYVIKKMRLNGEVRTWPHHFDTGSFVLLPNSDIGIGFGMAIPDTISKDYYLYTTGYIGHDAINSEKMPPLSKGKWGDDQWKGALLSVENLESIEWIRFFEESIGAYFNL